MKHRSSGRIVTVLLLVAAVTAGFAPSATAGAAYEFAGPVFGLAAGPGDVLFAADAGAGVVRFKDGEGQLIADLPRVTDVAPVRPGWMWAIAGRKLFKVVHGTPRFLVGLGKFERIVNPDGGEVDSNPFDVAGARHQARPDRRRGRERGAGREQAWWGQLGRDVAGRTRQHRERESAGRMPGRAARARRRSAGCRTRSRRSLWRRAWRSAPTAPTTSRS